MPPNPNLLVFQPFIVMAAAVGTAFPGVWLTAAQVKALADWSLVADGTEQEDGKPISESGLTVTRNQTVDLYRTYGTLAPVKSRRSSQDLMVGFNSPDMTLETLTRLINNASVTSVANVTPGESSHKEIDLSAGAAVAEVALMVWGNISGYSESFNGMYQVFRAVQTSSPALAYVKNALTEAEFSFQALKDPTNGLSKMLHQDADIN